MTCPPVEKTINYIEFRVTDIAATKQFFERVFGWTYTDYGPDYCEFSDGHMKGGFETGMPIPGGPLIVLYGTDLKGLHQSVIAAGGQITKEVFDFPGGKRFEFKDLNGYDFAVWSEA
ncbi:VOC family protein [Terasakiella pusilla]|jgi:predicted enzyme related to lactoylglutathione lyase|uniref:VOC family protein n=1 Tax=Terasakiella pusilla TaxID=64973 RepID=UPI00048BCE0D|nr:VOC family protein [Terasakiella pusilla]